MFTLVQCTPKGAKKAMSTDMTEKVMNPEKQAFRAQAPAPSEPPAIHVGEFSDFKLDNGLQVIVVENHKRPTVSYSIRVDRDPIYEGKKAGYVSLAGGLLEAGTENRSKEEIDETIDFIGGTLHTSGTSVYGKSLKKHSEKLLDLMQDVLLNPTFPESEFKKAKQKRISEIARGMTNPSVISSHIADMVAYGKDHPYGEFATKETIENITLDDVKEYYNTYFKPNISYLIIVGDITLAQAKAQAKKYFGSWKSGEVPTHNYETPELPETREVVFVDQPGAVQSVIKITYPVQLTEGDDDILAARVMDNILGGGVFSGYLMMNLREDKGYTYGARSQLSSDELVGQFTAYASVRNEVTDSAVVEFLRELNRIRNEAVDTAHLNLVKNVMTGSFARSLEHPETVARQAYNIFKYNLPADYYENYLLRLNKVSIEDVKAAAQMYIKPSHAYITVVGNKDEVADKLKRFSGNNSILYYSPTGERVKMINKELPVGLTADKVLSDYIVAIGGLKKIGPINSILWKMDLTMMGRTFNIVKMIEQPGKYKQAMMMNGMVANQVIYNNGKAVRIAMGQRHEIGADKIDEIAREAFIFDESHYKEMDATVELVAYDQVDGQEVYDVKITFKNGDVQHNYYSVESGLKLMETSSTTGPDGSAVTVITKLKDYKAVDGVLFPHTVIVEGAAPQPLTMKTTEIKINYDFKDDVFETGK